MAKKKKRPLKESVEDYFEQTRKPVYSFVLVVPFLLIYEVGMIILHSAPDKPEKYRVINGADYLIRSILSIIGVHGTFVSVVVIGVCFAVWEYRRRGGWKLDANVVGWLYAECMLYALFLFVMPGQLFAAAAGGKAPPGLFANIVLSCGAGVYEELVFRLILVGLLGLAFRQLLHLDNVRAGILAVAIGAIVFSAFHYKGLLGSYGDPFAPGTSAFWRSFIFRTAAGAFFSVLFYFRSFGVAVGAHALYDIMASVALALASAGE